MKRWECIVCGFIYDETEGCRMTGCVRIVA